MSGLEDPKNTVDPVPKLNGLSVWLTLPKRHALPRLARVPSEAVELLMVSVPEVFPRDVLPTIVLSRMLSVPPETAGDSVLVWLSKKSVPAVDTDPTRDTTEALDTAEALNADAPVDSESVPALTTVEEELYMLELP